MRCHRKILPIVYKDHFTNEEVRAKIQQAIESLTIVKRRKLSGRDMSPVHQVWPKPSCKEQWTGKNTRQTEEEVGRQREGMDWPGVRQVSEGSGKQVKMKETGCEIICGAPTTLAVQGLMKWGGGGMGDMSIPLQFASLYDGHQVYVWSDCLLDLGTDFLVGNVVFVWDAQSLAPALTTQVYMQPEFLQAI